MLQAESLTVFQVSPGATANGVLFFDYYQSKNGGEKQNSHRLREGRGGRRRGSGERKAGGVESGNTSSRSAPNPILSDNDPINSTALRTYFEVEEELYFLETRLAGVDVDLNRTRKELTHARSITTNFPKATIMLNHRKIDLKRPKTSKQPASNKLRSNKSRMFI